MECYLTSFYRNIMVSNKKKVFSRDKLESQVFIETLLVCSRCNQLYSWVNEEHLKVFFLKKNKLREFGLKSRPTNLESML